MDSYILFVEGDDDQRFFEILMQHLEIRGMEVEQVNGNVDMLHTAVPRIRRRINEGKGVAIVLDMDKLERGYVSKMEQLVSELSLPNESWFLMPDNRGEGDLETLLLQMTVPQHAQVEKCFDDYEECLRRASYSIPDRKGRIYAYCEAIGVETKGSKRDYADRSSWNLDAPALEPLKEFLRNLAGL